VANCRRLSKKDLGALVDAVQKERRFFGPAGRDPANGDNEIILMELSNEAEMSLDYENFKLPPKRHFVPQDEPLLTFDGESVEPATIPSQKAVLFGIRPCDAHSLRHLDRIFLDEPYVDPYYRQRRDETLIISMACNEPAHACFCTSVGAGPASTYGSDIMAVDLDGSIIFESISDAGDDFLKRYDELFSKPSKDELERRSEITGASEAKIPQLTLSEVSKKLEGMFDSSFWEEISEKCLACGVCTYSCPTCHCFSFHDEKSESGKGRRLKIQDTCIFPGFTLEASGHNPRIVAGQRMRQRILHKFKYAPERYEEFFCVGCGRCVLHCPVNMDIRETITEVIR
jgi:ferredoxin